MQHGESFAVSSCLNIRNLGPEPVVLRADSQTGRMFLRTTWLGKDTALRSHLLRSRHAHGVGRPLILHSHSSRWPHAAI